MQSFKSLTLLFLVSAVLVVAVGLPWLFRSRSTPSEYVPNRVATTKDIQEFDLMWSKLEVLQKQAAKLGPDEYKRRFIESTARYLALESDQKQNFVSVVNQGLHRLDEARHSFKTKRENNESSETKAVGFNGESPTVIAARRDRWSQWRDHQRQTSDLLLAALQPTPRHKLLAERRLLWLLKLDFSLRFSEKTATPPPSTG